MIGLFGGTFDPIHFGHLRPALDVMEALGLQQIRWIPAHRPPHRGAPRLTAAQRAEMVTIAIADQPGFVMDDCELRRHEPSYTVDTLMTMRTRYGAELPLVLLLGSDAFAGLPDWSRWQSILDLAHIVVMQRPGETFDRQKFPAGFFTGMTTKDPADLQKLPAGKLFEISVTQLDISATDIRQRLKRGQSVRYLLPEPLVDYLDIHQQIFKENLACHSQGRVNKP